MAEERVQRRLAAILAADVVGYSRLIEADEEGTRARLQLLHTELINPRIAADGGRIVKTTGDGILVEFPSAVDAVRNALAIQSATAGYSAELPLDQRLEFRVGVNLGDVIIEGDDIHGDGVNVAARLEGLCGAGEVYVSSTVYDHVDGKLNATFDDLGEQAVKNISRLVRVYRARDETGPAQPRGGVNIVQALPDKPSIAVLPFANMSGDPEQEYFADGLTEDIITALSRIRSFFVIARNTTFTFKGQAVDVQAVAKDLGVGYVLEGSVRKSGNRLRITAQLIDGVTGNHVWAERYDRELQDIFDVQDEITDTVVGAIEPELGRAEQERARAKSPQSLHAWDIYQRGMWHLYRRSRKDLEEALSLFLQAIEEAPSLAVAYAGAAEACFFQVSSGYAESPDGMRERMIEFGRSAVDRDDLDAFCHVALGRAYNLRGDNAAAISELETATSLNPSYAHAHYSLGWTLIWGMQPDAGIPHIEAAMRLSPHDPAFGQFLARMGEAYLFQRRAEEAVDWARQSLRQPNMQISRWVLFAASLAHAGHGDDARQAIESLRQMNPTYGIGAARDIWRISDPKTLDYLLDGLRLAGLPE
ncbi:MAG: tetratricopeptide repeat protein [Rhodospirillales bacterium]|nr:tetratricopeptide repeat protein [Rhodospirillales bacterium]